MSGQEPDDSDEAWMSRYRQASRAGAPLPSQATRDAILAEGRRVAAARAANPSTHAFDPKQPAANQPRWKLAAFGTLGAALLATVLMFPHLGAPPPALENRISSVSAPAKSAPVQTPAADAPSEAPGTESLERVIVTGAKQAARQAGAPAMKRRESDFASPARALNNKSAPPPDEITMGAQRLVPRAPSADALAAPPAAGRATAAALAQPTLLSSVASGDLARTRELLDIGASTEQFDSAGRSPLLLAVISKRADLVTVLLAHGADPNAVDRAGETPLHRARRDASTEIATLLEQAGAR